MRLFYTCPIKAAYMAKEFGVKFEVTHYVYDSVDDLKNLNGKPEAMITSHPGEIILGKVDGEKIFVAKESEDVFNPKEEDIGLSRKGELTVFNEEEKWEGFDCSSSSAMDASKIILRDGKQFFAPEVEND